MINKDNKLNNEGNVNSILKELSDIKVSLGVNTNETQNIKSSIGEIKSDIHEIKANYITQEQHTQLVTNLNTHSSANDKTTADHENRIRNNETNITKIMTWGSALVLLIGIVEFLLNKFIK